jgi:hypothetical protein
VARRAYRRVVRKLLVLLLLVASFVACGDDDDDDDTAASVTTTSTTDASTSSSSSTTSTTVDFDGSTTATDIPSAGSGVLTDVRAGAEGGLERVVFEFRDDALPGAHIEYVDPPITQDGSGEQIAVDGDAFLQIVFNPATGYDFDAGTEAYTGPDRVTGGTTVVQEVVRTGDFEGYLTWVIGLSSEVEYRALTLDDGRFVIELAAG